MDKLNELATKITQMLDGVLPTNVRCAFVLLDTATAEITSASDMPDEETVILLEETIETLKTPEGETAQIDGIRFNPKVSN